MQQIENTKKDLREYTHTLLKENVRLEAFLDEAQYMLSTLLEVDLPTDLTKAHELLREEFELFLTETETEQTIGDTYGTQSLHSL